VEQHARTPRDTPAGAAPPGAQAAQPRAPRPRAGPRHGRAGGARRLREDWQRIQDGFADDPRAGVVAADSLVGEAVEQCTALLNERRRRIESGWQRPGGDGDTERLRAALREYRALLDRVAAVLDWADRARAQSRGSSRSP